MNTFAIHHLALTATDLKLSKKFYNSLLGLLGYHLHVEHENVLAWSGPQPEIILYSAKEEQKENAHKLYDPGIHHVAFQVESPRQVDAACELAELNGGTILDSPKLYPQYGEDYYATFILDPDGIKIEVVSM